MADSGNINPLYDASTDNQEISADSQSMINKPLEGGQLKPEERELLDSIIKLVDEGAINLYQPSTLFNEDAYNALNDEGKAKADQAAMNMLSKIRTAVDWDKANMDTNIQVSQMIAALLQDRNRLEAESNLFKF